MNPTRQEITAFSKRLKKHLSETMALPALRVHTYSAGGNNPYIYFRLTFDAGLTFPASFRSRCLSAVYGPEFKVNPDNPEAGNIRLTCVSMVYNQWKAMFPEV